MDQISAEERQEEKEREDRRRMPPPAPRPPKPTEYTVTFRNTSIINSDVIFLEHYPQNEIVTLFVSDDNCRTENSLSFFFDGIRYVSTSLPSKYRIKRGEQWSLDTYEHQFGFVFVIAYGTITFSNERFLTT